NSLKHDLQYKSLSQPRHRRTASSLQIVHQGSSSSSPFDGPEATALAQVVGLSISSSESVGFSLASSFPSSAYLCANFLASSSSLRQSSESLSGSCGREGPLSVPPVGKSLRAFNRLMISSSCSNRWRSSSLSSLLSSAYLPIKSCTCSSSVRLSGVRNLWAAFL
uniref:Uncharacterized protein n=1 Tax=Anopheles atroparvus TaxID=41427 RepID=A0AAG5CMN3_ANOAO